MLSAFCKPKRPRGRPPSSDRNSKRNIEAVDKSKSEGTEKRKRGRPAGLYKRHGSSGKLKREKCLRSPTRPVIL
jgi:hypothetical protein